MSRVNTLSSAKNRELFTKLKNGDTSVRETIIKGNINLVYYTFSRYFKNLEVKEYEDLGLIGLIKAVDRYDVEKNADFATFSIICIKNEILGELKKISKTKGDVSLYDGIPWLIEDDEDMQLINCIPDSKDLIDDFISSVSYEKITSELFTPLQRDVENTIEVSVTDGIASDSYFMTFIKDNSAPIIKYNGDTDLGGLDNLPTIQYSVSDPDKDKVTVIEKLNGYVNVIVVMKL